VSPNLELDRGLAFSLFVLDMKYAISTLFLYFLLFFFDFRYFTVIAELFAEIYSKIPILNQNATIFNYIFLLFAVLLHPKMKKSNIKN